jgi:hypothetical protein
MSPTAPSSSSRIRAFVWGCSEAWQTPKITPVRLTAATTVRVSASVGAIGFSRRR